METYRQPLRIESEKNLTMVGLVSDLTGLIRGYYQNWKRPLAERREDLQKAKILGRTIVGLASQRPWRENALQDVLRSLRVQDRYMHHLVSDLLTDARAAHKIAVHKGLQKELQYAFQGGTREDIWQVSKDLYRLGQQTLVFIASDPAHRTAISRHLEVVRREDPTIHRQIVSTLNEVAALKTKGERSEMPRPRLPRREVEVYRSAR